LGRHVIRELLEHDYDVLSLDKVAPQSKVCPSWIADLTRASDIYQALKGCDGIVHLGAYQAPNLAPDTEIFANNVTATYNVLKAATDLGVKKIVISSSIAAFGFIYAYRPWPPDYLPLDEDHPGKPQDPYGLSKVVGERIADSFAATHQVTISSLRFPGINFDITYTDFRERHRDPEARRWGLWSYIDARDTASACRLALEATFQGHEVFLAAAPTSAMNLDTNELIRKYLPEVKKVKEGRKGNWSCVDSAKAEKMLGFRARHTWEKHLGKQTCSGRSSSDAPSPLSSPPTGGEGGVRGKRSE